MSITIPSGQGITLRGTFADAAGTPVTPTSGELVVTDPNGAATTYPLGGLTSPSTGVYTKTIAPILAGRWTYVFHATGGVLAAAPGAFSVSPEDWTPTVADVGRKLHTRTKNGNGEETGTFTSATTVDVHLRTIPSAEDVQAIIEEETGALTGFVGSTLPPALWALAHKAALNRIAARIEQDFFPEQVQSGRSPYDQLVADRDLEEGRLISAMRAHTATLEGATGAGFASVTMRSQATIDSETLPLPSDDVPPYTSTGWPLADPQTGAAGTIV